MKYGDTKNKKTFDGRTCPEGMELAPVVASESMIEFLLPYGLVKSNIYKIKIRRVARLIPTVFIAVKPEQVPDMDSFYDSQIHEFLNPHEKELLYKKNVISLDEKLRKSTGKGFDSADDEGDTTLYDVIPNKGDHKVETIFVKQFFVELQKISEEYAAVIQMLYEGYTGVEIGEIMYPDLHRSRRYERIKKARKAAADLYKKMSR